MTAEELNRNLVKLDWTGRGLAERVGVGEQRVSMWRNDKGDVPKYVQSYVMLAVRVKDLVDSL